MDTINGKYGQFDLSRPATYIIHDLGMETSWEYIFQNREILLRLDQYGPVAAQAYPPGDIMLFKREKDDKYSKWLVWIKGDCVNRGIPFNNFCRPAIGPGADEGPENLKITFQPHMAKYSYEIDGLEVNTTFFVPRKGTDIVMKFRITSHREEVAELSVTPAMLPYVNPAQLAPWDRPEWYVKTGAGMEKELVFWSQLWNPQAVPGSRRAATLWSSRENMQSFDVSAEKFCSSTDFNHPCSLYREHLRLGRECLESYGVHGEENTVCGYPSVYAAQYKISLNPGESREITQVLSFLPLNEEYLLPDLAAASRPLKYFDRQVFDTEVEVQRRFYEGLCGKWGIRTQDRFFDHYINTWLPLQMYWTASLDRGWPTGMRGSRDCANDFMGELFFDSGWAKKILLLLLECEREDGWIPRQIGTAGRTGRHDLREFVDAGAFALEFVYEYLCFTGDADILSERVQWLGDGPKSSVWEHCLRILSYYTDLENIGEHGLCKIRGGDWLDAVNNAGLKGRGESVMVTAQVILAMDYVQEIAASYALSIPDPQKISDARDQFEAALNREAYNQSGFYSGVFTDNGEWLFSHKDPDGECRPYICANAYAIVCGAADTRQRESILEHFGRLKSESGYRLFAPALGKKPVSCAGRLGSGDAFGGLFENASPYNHGSHGFLGRSFSVMGRGEELYEALQYLLPFDQQKHNTVQAMTPPYAIVNCWQDIPLFKGRGGMTFLTGSIAMAIRLTYQWMFGIRPGLEGLIIDPCLSESMTGAEVSFSIRNKKILLHISGQEDSRVRINGMPYSYEKYLKRERRNAVFIPYEVLEPENEIWV